jgi:hypothetical protein
MFIPGKIGIVTVEFSLNLAWAAMATAMFILWLRVRSSRQSNGGMQLAALTVCILILLPVISISDDLMTAQVPAETDTSLRWGQRALLCHTVPHHIPVLLHAPPAGLFSAPTDKLAAETSHMAFVFPQLSIRLLNRPPPAA